MSAGLAPGDGLGPYRIVARLGAGGMGEVYLAEDVRLRRRVAVKVLPAEILKDADRRRRFLSEARSAAAVDHPNIIHIYEVREEPDGRVYIVMQHVEGRTLRESLAGGGAGDLQRSLALAEEIADALAAAHARGIVHRDVKPDNVMVDASGHARLLDFGLARALEPAGPGLSPTEVETLGSPTTSAGAVMGTVAYMSPEQAVGEPVDHRSDIFSFGVTLYEMIAGRHPFAGRTPVDTTDALLHREPKPVTDVIPAAPPELQWILSKMMAKDREARYQSAREVLVDLRRIRASGSGPAAPAARPRRAGPWWAWALVAAAAGAVPALFALGVLPWGGRAARDRGHEKHVTVPIPPMPVPPRMRELQFLEDVDAPPQPIRLAVLPFENVRKDASLDYLGFALADAIIAKLSYLRSVSVLPSSYVRKYRERQPDPKEIRADLGVDHALTGGFVASGERLRVSLQLVNLEAGTLRWESSLDVSRKELLGLQDEIVERVVSGMEVTLTEDEEDRIQRDAPSDPDAYDIALRTLDIPATVEGTRRAIRQLEESLERDPRFAPAWGILATRQYDATLYGREDPSLHEAAERSARRALEINPEQPIALQMLGVILTERGRHEEAYLTIKKWTRVNPSLAEAHFNLSYVFRYTGLFEEAAEAARRAVALAPNNPRFRSLGFLYQYMGDHDLAETFLNLDRGSPWSLSNLSTLAFVRGDRASARALAEEALAADPNGHFAVAARALMETLDGDLAGAARTLRRMAAVPSPDPEMTFWVGAGFAAVGARDEAIETLWRAVRGGFYAAPLYETDPRLETLRRDPRFAAILEEVRRRRDAFRAFVEANP